MNKTMRTNISGNTRVLNASLNEILNALLVEHDEMATSVYLYATDQEYPLLNIMVDGESSFLTYIESEDISYVPDDPSNQTDDFVVFREYPGDHTFEIEACSVISTEKALLAVEQFFDTHKCSQDFAWREV